MTGLFWDGRQHHYSRAEPPLTVHQRQTWEAPEGRRRSRAKGSVFLAPRFPPYACVCHVSYSGRRCAALGASSARAPAHTYAPMRAHNPRVTWGAGGAAPARDLHRSRPRRTASTRRGARDTQHRQPGRGASRTGEARGCQAMSSISRTPPSGASQGSALSPGSCAAGGCVSVPAAGRAQSRFEDDF